MLKFSNIFFFDFQPFFVENVVLAPPAIFQKNRVFWGEKGQDPGQNKDLDTRTKMLRGTPKTTTQCENSPTGIPNFGWCAAAADQLLTNPNQPEPTLLPIILNQPCRRAPHTDPENFQTISD